MYGTFCDKGKGVRSCVYVSIYENDHSQTDEKRQ